MPVSAISHPKNALALLADKGLGGLGGVGHTTDGMQGMGELAGVAVDDALGGEGVDAHLA